MAAGMAEAVDIEAEEPVEQVEVDNKVVRAVRMQLGLRALEAGPLLQQHWPWSLRQSLALEP